MSAEEHSQPWLRPRGSNQIGMSQFNERVVLQAIRLHGSMPKADLARLTNLSTQTISLIIARLLEQGLVLKRAPLRGKVGQPSVPIQLNPEGAFFIGIKIGRRSVDLLLIDFTGQARERSSLFYRYPDPGTLFEQIEAMLKDLCAKLGTQRIERLIGIGVAAPLGLGGWQQLLDSTPQQASQWDQIDIRGRIQAMTGLPVAFAKDTIAACVAELVIGRGRSIPSFLYVFIGTFIGGGIVLNSALHAGLQGNAGAIGSLPLGLADGTPPMQLLNVASLFYLERLYAAAGLDENASYDARALQMPWLEHTETWLEQAARAIALTVISTNCLLDIGSVIVDASAHPLLRERVQAAIETALDRYSWEGVQRPALHTGTVGADARAIGAALLPLHANFAPDRELFLKILRVAPPQTARFGAV